MAILVAGIAISGATATSGATAKGAAGLTTLKVAIYPSVDYAPLFVGLKRNIFKKAGLDLKIQYLYSGSALAAAIASNQVDIGTDSVTAGSNAIVQGLSMKMLTATDYQPTKKNMEVLVKSSSSIKSYKDLEGKTVASTNVQGLAQLGVSVAMQKEGADPSKMKFLVFGAATLANTLLAGQVDAVIVQDPFLSQDLAISGIRSLGNPFAKVPYRIGAGAWFASNQTISSKAPDLRKFLAAWKQSVAIATKNPKLTRQIVGKYTGITGSLLAGLTLPDYTSGMPARDLGPMLAQMKAYGWITVIPTYDALVWDGK
jgi:NitT/TauT family transport system substrate-binding protein